MTLLLPSALIGLSLLAIPIVVHLLRPRKTRPLPFSSLRWLKESQQRLSRRIQWHQWLLFLVRASIITFLVVALAKPFVSSGSGSEPTDRLIVLDTSLPMTAGGVAGADHTTPMDRARELAVAWLTNASPRDRTGVLLSGGPPKLLIPLASDAATHASRLTSVTASAATPDLGPALALVPTLLGSSTRPVELVFLTAGQPAGWHAGDLQELTRSLGDRLRVIVVDVGETIPANAWIASARLLRGEADETLLRVDVGFAGSGGGQRTVRLRGPGSLQDSQAVALSAGKLGRAHFRLPAGPTTADDVVTLELAPTDALPADDRHYLPLQPPAAIHALVVEGQEGAGQYLTTAIDALAGAMPGSLRGTRRTASQVTAQDLGNAQVVLLAGAVELAADLRELLARRVREGAGVVAFLGPERGPAGTRPAWIDTLPDSAAWLPLAEKTKLADVSQQPTTLARLRWSHGVLSNLWDPRGSDLAECRFRHYRRFASEPGPTTTVAARYEDGTPALIDHALGAGRILVWNTSADDSWGDLSRARAFVPLVDRMLSYLAPGGSGSYRVGEPARFLLPREVRSAVVTAPDGSHLGARLESRANEGILHLDAFRVPGVHKVSDRDRPERVWSMAVNVGLEASALQQLDADLLKSWWQPAPVEIFSQEAAQAHLRTHGAAWALAPWCVVLAGILLLVETLYVTRLCPRRNPPVAGGVVPQRGILRPLEADAT